IYITFPTIMTGGWMVPGRFGTLGADTVTGATPLGMMRVGNIPSLMDLLGGVRMGAAGESAIILILLAAVYLIYTKTASWKSILSTVLSFLVLQSVFFYSGLISAPPLESLLAGSILFIAVFMVTDPISSAKKPLGQVMYGIVIGVSLTLIRNFSLFPEGASFAILMGNMFAPLLDELAVKLKKKGVKK
ncbi:MAG: RnfABCDGE type electron transport complex subunit D, partial [Spirochaetales bacterium]|nr:RnfABCDGE type electron transport complex subunit D [Spirochaetales bacterium]